MTPSDANLATAEHLRTLADRLDRGEISGIFTAWLEGGTAKWSHCTAPGQVHGHDRGHSDLPARACATADGV